MPLKQTTTKKPSPRQFRLPTDLLDWLRAKAEENSRTMNGELTAMLKEARKRDQEEAHAQTA